MGDIQPLAVIQFATIVNFFKVVSRNSFRSKKWQAEEREGPMPFERLVDFDLQFKRKNGAIEV